MKTPEAPRTPPRTYAVKLGAGADGMPTSLFDPRWREPEVASRVAFVLYCRSADDEGRAPLAPDAPAVRPDLTDARTFALTDVHSIEAAGGTRRFKGGSYGELHRHYAFGKYTVNFHAQAVAFGFDDVGHWFLSSTVGRFDGPWGNDALLTVRWCAGNDVVGAGVWHKALDPVGNTRVHLVGRDAMLARRFDDVDSAEVAFTARHGKDVPEPAATGAAEPRPSRLSRARRSVLTRELPKILALGDGQARAAQLKKLLTGISADEVRELLAQAAPGTDPTAIVRLLEPEAKT